VAHGLMGTGRWMVGCPGWPVGPVAGAVEEAAAEEDEDETPTHWHEGHIVRVVGGFICM
jgi:hypothetical protein